MTFKLTQEILDEALAKLNDSSQPDLEIRRKNFYDTLASADDRYSMLASSVAGGESTVMGAGSEAFLYSAVEKYRGTPLSKDEYSKITKMMAEEYGEILKTKLRETPNSSDFELTWEEAFDLHVKVFGEFKLPIEVWSMGMPMKVFSNDTNDFIWEEALKAAELKDTGDSIEVSWSIAWRMGIRLSILSQKSSEAMLTPEEEKEFSDIMSWTIHSVGTRAEISNAIVDKLVKDGNPLYDITFGMGIIYTISSYYSGYGDLFSSGNAGKTIALTQILYKMNPSLTLASKDMVEAYGGILTDLRQEEILSTLAGIFLGQKVNITNLSNTTTYSQTVNAILNELTLRNFNDKDAHKLYNFRGIDKNTLIIFAKSNLAYMYALVNGNIFAVDGVDYTKHNQNGELDLYNPETNEGQLTDQYLHDRASYIQALIDTKAYGNSSGTNTTYEDLNDPNDSIGLASWDGKLVIFGKNTEDIDQVDINNYRYKNINLYMGSGNDIINISNTEKFTDQFYIEGGAGNDILSFSGSGSLENLDISGNDTYSFKNLSHDSLITIIDEEGNDTYIFDQHGTYNLTDKDGKGSVSYMGADMKTIDPTQWRYIEHNGLSDWVYGDKWLFRPEEIGKDDAGNSIYTLTIHNYTSISEGLGNAKDKVIINDFKDGDLGINLVPHDILISPDEHNGLADGKLPLASLNWTGKGNLYSYLHFKENPKVGTVLTLTFKGSIPNGLQVNIGGETHTIQNGHIEYTVKENTFTRKSAGSLEFTVLFNEHPIDDNDKHPSVVISAEYSQNNKKNKSQANWKGENSDDLLPPTMVDPIILDLNGDGVTTSSTKDKQIYFDHDGNGFKELTGWVSSNDGLLVIDKNQDGIINDGSELFGNHAFLPDGTKASHGFEMLASYDLNGDGVIDEKDEIFNELKVWVDKNSDGKTDKGELHSLKDLGIKALNLYYQNSNIKDSSGNIHTQTGFFIKDNGEKGQMNDVWFQSQSEKTTYDPIEINNDVLGLTNLAGSGHLRSLHEVMTLDLTGNLKQTVIDLEDLIRAGVEQKSDLYSVIKNMVYQWTGVADKPTRGLSYPSYLVTDDRVIYALEKFYGRNLRTGAPLYFDRMFNKLMENITDKFIQSVVINDLMAHISYTWDSENNKKVLDVFELATMLQSLLDKSSNNFKIVFETFMKKQDSNIILVALTAMADLMSSELLTAMDLDKYSDLMRKGSMGDDTLFGTDKVDILVGGDGDDTIYGRLGNDTIYGDDGDDQLYGNEGDDELHGGEGDDLLVGGKGNDILYGDGGNNTYQFSKGDGYDTVITNGRPYEMNSNSLDVRPQDIIKFTDVRSDEVSYKGENHDLIITYGENDKIRIVNFFSGERGNHKYSYKNSLHQISFVDKTITLEDLEKIRIPVYISGQSNGYWSWAGALDIYYIDGSGDLSGLTSNVNIIGNDSNNFITGGQGDDLIIGGKGDDYLEGGAGNNIYQFSIGDGNDIISNTSHYYNYNDAIHFLDIKSTDATYRLDGMDLIISYSINDSVTIRDMFNAYSYSSSGFKLKEIQFSDRTITLADLEKMPMDANNNELNNYIYTWGGIITQKNKDGVILVYDGSIGLTTYGTNASENIVGIFNQNNILIGGKGNDHLKGSNKNNTYVFSKGDGQDIIDSHNPTDFNDRNNVVQFIDINSEEVTYHGKNYDLVIEYGNGDCIIIQNFFKGGNYRINELHFIDKILSIEDLEKIRINMEFTDNNISVSSIVWDGELVIKDLDGKIHFINIENYNKVISGTDSDDFIALIDGNFEVIGGKGDDYFYLESPSYGEQNIVSGNKDYIFRQGDGNDTIDLSMQYQTSISGQHRIIFKDINKYEVQYKAENNDLIIIYGEEDSIRIVNFFLSDTNIDEIQFADNKSISRTDIEIIIEEMYGKNDVVIIGTSEDDFLMSPESIYTKKDSITYQFSKGSGNDIIFNYSENNHHQNDIDIIHFTDVHSSEVEIQVEYIDLIIRYGSNDTVRISGFFADINNSIDVIKFTDKEITLDNLLSNIRVAPNSFYSTWWNGNVTMQGTDQKDLIHIMESGLGGTMTIVTGKGNDTISKNGHKENTVYLFEKGDGDDVIYIQKYNPNPYDIQDSNKPQDIIKFLNVNRDEATLYLEDYTTLVIRYGKDDFVRIPNFIQNYSDTYLINEIQFADGFTLSHNNIMALVEEPNSEIENVSSSSFVSANQELHLLINAMATFDSGNSANDDFMVTTDQSLSRPMLTTSAY